MKKRTNPQLKFQEGFAIFLWIADGELENLAL